MTHDPRERSRRWIRTKDVLLIGMVAIVIGGTVLYEWVDSARRFDPRFAPRTRVAWHRIAFVAVHLGVAVFAWGVWLALRDWRAPLGKRILAGAATVAVLSTIPFAFDAVSAWGAPSEHEITVVNRSKGLLLEVHVSGDGVRADFGHMPPGESRTRHVTLPPVTLELRAIARGREIRETFERGAEHMTLIVSDRGRVEVQGGG